MNSPPPGQSDNDVDPGDIWTAAFDRFRPVVVLSKIDNDGLRGVVAVERANADISGVAVEVDLGFSDYVVRVALPRPKQINCSWVLTLSKDDLVEKVGSLSSAKLSEVKNLILMVHQG